MVVSETRFRLLAWLGWELRAASVGSWMVIPAKGEPVLYVRCASGARDAVLAVRRGRSWRVVWRARELETDAARLKSVARRIAREATA
ncbi:hypothetical protein [Thermomonospora cellulosilytica]|uniref:Uncharacterized protein n=1 Tax=Thermomonospora cellulosilytica TaxID=1411118 RepID=A0A7W3N4V1_9ACTN|nr:hypothetical protein [Thermomonospora cellulosilytica]MBA9007566.1 hypothetical protein [Thermomonospora cellulosilytica]